MAKPPAPSLWLLLALTVLAGCKKATIDGSNEAAFQASLKTIRNGLPARERKRFDQAFGLIAVGTAGSTLEAKFARQRLHGLDAVHVIDAAARTMSRGRARPDDVGETSHEPAIRRNEAAAVAALRALAGAQTRFKNRHALDTDADGDGEYGFFGELTGEVALRDHAGRRNGGVLAQPVLAKTFAVDAAGRARKSGYLFQIWLPAAGGRPTSEASGQAVGPRAPAPTEAARTWCCYAWPLRYAVTGKRAFFVDQRGGVLASANQTRRYGGSENAPPPLAAFPRGTTSLTSRAGGGRASDGQIWQP